MTGFSAISILIIEGEEILAEGLLPQLTAQFQRVCVEHTLARSVERLAEGFDVVLLDLRLAGGRGMELLQRSRDSAPATEVIAITAQPSLESAVDAFRAGAFDYLSRPVTAEVLLERVRAAVDRQRGRTAALQRMQRADEEAFALRRAEEELAVERRRTANELDTFFTLSKDLFCIASFEGRFLRTNPAFEEVLGYELTELHRLQLTDLLHPEDVAPTLAEVARLSQGVPTLKFENRYRRKDGSYRRLSWICVPVIETRQLYAVARDITTQRELEARLTLSERMASIGSLAAGVAHEINNPLSYTISNVRFAVEALREQGSNPELAGETMEALVEALEGAERVRVIVRDLKSFSGPQEQAGRPIDVHQVLDGAISMASNEIRHRARLVRAYGTVGPISGVESRLGQVFLNLLINAAQAIPEGSADQHRIEVRTGTEPDGRARIEVSDTGCGIPPELLRRIFDPFFTTKPIGVGTGLGLSVCHTLVAAMGGQIRVTSQVGEGTRFTVLLPPAELAEAGADEAPGPAAAPPFRGRVMFIDDEVLVARAAQRVLQKEHEVEIVDDARRALERLLSGEAVDVIFCDVMMPSLAAPEFYRQLTSARPDLANRIVFVTGGTFTDAATRFLAEVNCPLLEKPFQREALKAAVVERMLAR